MSWIFAYFGKDVSRAVSRFRELNLQPLYEAKNDKLFVVSGGGTETVSGNISDDTANWIVCGIGIVTSQQSVKFAGKNDWGKLIADPTVNSLSGHYTGLTWNNREATIFTDRIGLRDIYFAKTADGIIISTRPDWLRPFTDLTINFKEFSSRWLLFNQISHNSILDGCSRLTAGSGIKIDLSNHEINKFSNTFDYPERITDDRDLEACLKQFFVLPSSAGKSLSLSLSGGMDSRVLMSMLKNSKSESWDTHTFGPPDHPDSSIARQITSELRIPHRQIDLPQPPAEVILTELKEYVTSTLVNNPASAIIQLRNYNDLMNRNLVVMDGGFGEIWRREFLFKLEMRGTRAILEGNVEEITKYMRHFRSDIFNHEISRDLESAAVEQVSRIITSLPSPREIGIGNWLDFMAIKTRIPNYYGHEQARLDELISAVMPFAQAKMFELLFSYPVKTRRNGKLFKSIINSNSPVLKSFRLAKGNVTSPYGLSSFQSRVFAFASKKMNRNTYIDNRTDDFLKQVKEYIYDITNSADFNNCSYYDHDKIKRMVDEHYKGNAGLSNQLDWFLSFELFRQSINSNTP